MTRNAIKDIGNIVYGLGYNVLEVLRAVKNLKVDTLLIIRLKRRCGDAFGLPFRFSMEGQILFATANYRNF